jgi:hypothetical protein
LALFVKTFLAVFLIVGVEARIAPTPVDGVLIPRDVFTTLAASFKGQL